jgi:hypothetical protein
MVSRPPLIFQFTLCYLHYLHEFACTDIKTSFRSASGRARTLELPNTAEESYRLDREFLLYFVTADDKRSRYVPGKDFR